MVATRSQAVAGLEPPAACGSQGGTLFHTTSQSVAGPAGRNEALSPEDLSLILDVGQMVLDIVGIFEPTPFADTANAVVSAVRGDLLGAGISAIGTLPYVGDLAKAGKLPRYLSVIDRALLRSKQNPRFAKLARSSLVRLKELLDGVVLESLPPDVARHLTRVREKLARHFGAARAADKLPATLVTQTLEWWKKYIDALPLPAPPPGKGVLWSKITALGAKKLVRHRNAGEYTLEMLLARHTDFFRQYAQRIEPLRKRFGDQVWEQIEQPIWKQLSEKYARSLRGSVTAYTDRLKFDAHQRASLAAMGRNRETKSNAGAVLGDELMELIEQMMRQNPNVTEVVLVDVAGRVRPSTLTRQHVLQSARVIN
jgi:hypothetical protein